MIANRTSGFGILAVVIVAGIGILLALQGWRSRIPDVQDEILAIDGAHALLAHGRIPDRGGVTNYASYFPPGTTWLVVPGVLVFSDPRLFEVLGSTLLYIGTLVGIFLLARTYFGLRCAFLSVLLYGLSERALHLASVLSPRGHPFFYIWLAYWTYSWVRRNDSKYLAAAIVTWAVGMYVHMELAPAVFILPVVWLFYRPTVRLRSLAVAGVLSLVVWYPYLRFQTTRNFADIRSQVLLQDLLPANYRDAWCDPTLAVRQWGTQTNGSLASGNSGTESLTSRFMSALGRRGLALVQGLPSNFEARIFATDFALLASLLMGLVLLSLPRRRFSALGIEESPSLGLQRRLTLMAVAFLVSAVLANEWIAPYLAPDGRLEPDTVLHIRILQAMLALAGIALLMRRSVGRALEPLFLAVPSRQSDPRLLVIAVVVPWLILLFIVEPGRIDRFVGVWPLQVIVLAAFCETMFAQLRAARVGRWIGQVVIAGMIVVNPLVISRIDDWLRNGWSGNDSALVPVADYLASLLRSEGKDRSSIGYQLFVPGPYVAATAVDARYKVGVQLDFLLEYRRGLVNVNQCAEGLSAHDEYRIVQPRPSGPDETHYFDVPFDSRFHLLRTIGQYQIYKRA